MIHRSGSQIYKQQLLNKPSGKRTADFAGTVITPFAGAPEYQLILIGLFKLL